MHPGTRWPLVGLGIGLCLSVLCWMEVEASFSQKFCVVNVHGSISIDSVYEEMAKESKEGLFQYEYRLFGFNVESKHDWKGFRPTEYRGLPGGRWMLYSSVLIVCLLLGWLPWLFERPRKVETTELPY